MGWGQGRRRTWSCCRPSAGVPPGEGSQEGKGAGLLELWCCGPTAGLWARLSITPGLSHGGRGGGAQALGSILGEWPEGEVRARACPPRCWRSVTLLLPAGVALSGSPGAFLPGETEVRAQAQASCCPRAQASALWAGCGSLGAGCSPAGRQGSGHMCPARSEVCPGPSHHLAFLPGSIPGRYVWGHFQAHQFFVFNFILFNTKKHLYWDVAT